MSKSQDIQIEPKRAWGDIMMLVQLLNLIEGLAALVGQDEFKRRYPEFLIAVRKIKARIRSEFKKARLASYRLG